MRAEEVWFCDSLAARASRIALLPAAGLYGTGFALYRALYDGGLKRAYRAPIPVLCVGNLAVGGSGKTPTVLHIADVLNGIGREVVVSASGYGSPRAEAATVAPPGPLDPREWGDEPAMMRWLRPDLKLVVGRRRPLAAQLVGEAHPKAVLLMDDGFQHLPLAKSLTILLDPDEPRNPYPLPAGPYREFRSARRRADLVLGTSAARSGLEREDPVVHDRGFQAAMEGADRLVGGSDFRLLYETSEVRTPEGEPVEKGDAGLVTAIAQPWRFVDTVGELGFFPAIRRTLPDHDPLDASDLLTDFPEGGLVLTTPKDWVKLSLRSDVARFRWGIVRREARVYPGDAFAGWLRERIGGD